MSEFGGCLRRYLSLNVWRMIGDCSVFIPTRDSSAHILIFLKAYRALGLEPTYIVDSRSVDGTAELLLQNGARAIAFRPSADYAEAGGIEFASRQFQSTWMLRLDDDEFPSRALLRAVQNRTANTKNIAFHIPCRELFRRDGMIFENRAKSLSVVDDHYTSVPVRLWRREAVTYYSSVHSSGFRPPRYCGIFQPDEYFTHFDRLMRSARYRLEKMRRYDAMGGPGRNRLSIEYLPELFTLAQTRAVATDVSDIQDLLAEIPVPDADLSMIDQTERALMLEAVLAHEQRAYKSVRFRDRDTTANVALAWIEDVLFTLGIGRS